MSADQIWVPVKEPIVVVKQDGEQITEVDQSIAFERKTLGRSDTGFAERSKNWRDPFVKPTDTPFELPRA